MVGYPEYESGAAVYVDDLAVGGDHGDAFVHALHDLVVYVVVFEHALCVQKISVLPLGFQTSPGFVRARAQSSLRNSHRHY